MEALDGITYIFTIPAESVNRNCSGTVVAIQYCYHAELTNADINSRSVLNIFDLLSVTTLDTSSLLTVRERFTVTSTAAEDNCMLGSQVKGRTPHDCCTTTTLDSSQQFQIPPSSYTFGIQVLSEYPGIPYFFRAAATEFNVNQCQIPIVTGDNFNLAVSCLTGRSLFLLRFVVGKEEK